ncbi:hypothetical protein E2C01_096178 [Portunus trituberculatus]|uniref:Uncharacterized protein n=1 Tax=Portunus trituberculatus TaxID=210409 RepID=A0A5B7K5X6_PORTR|nr:hypothetical protein [Portunus trituberculatus]
MNAALRNNALRNTVHALYLATEELQGGMERMYRVTLHISASSGGKVWVKCFVRCLYCEAGSIGVSLADRWSPNSGFLIGAPLFHG